MAGLLTLRRSIVKRARMEATFGRTKFPRRPVPPPQKAFRDRRFVVKHKKDLKGGDND